jgi:hypothetical protein
MAQLSEINCSNCHAANAATSAFCSACGSKLNTESNMPPPIDKMKTPIKAVQIIGVVLILFVIGGLIIWIANGGLYKDNTQTPTTIERESVRPSSNSLASSPAPTPQATDTPGLTEEQANELAKPSTPIEYQLAVMDAGHLIPKDDPTVEEFQKLLVTLRKKTGYSFADIRQKNMYACMEVRKKTGLPVKLYGFMLISLDLVKKYPKNDYNEILAGMVVNSELFKQYYEQQPQ